MPSSVVLTRIEKLDLVSKSNITAVFKESLSIVKLVLLSSPVPSTRLYVWLSPGSGSVVENMPTTVPADSFSFILLFESEILVGVSFIAVTVILISNVSLTKPSLT